MEDPAFVLNQELKVTDDHKQQAADLVQSIKDANPGHPFFTHIENAMKSLGDDAAMIPLMGLLLLTGGRTNAFM